MTLEKTKYKILLNGQVSEKFKVGRGLKQGNPLSTTLFNIVLEAAVRECGIHLNRTIYNQKAQTMVYVDDIILLTRTNSNPIEVFKGLERETGVYRLKINEKKTKYLLLESGGVSNLERNLEFVAEDAELYYFDRVNKFNYLGVTVTAKNEEAKEIERIARGDIFLRNMFSSKNISRDVKLQVYSTQ